MRGGPPKIEVLKTTIVITAKPVEPGIHAVRAVFDPGLSRQIRRRVEFDLVLDNLTAAVGLTFRMKGK